MNQAFKGRIYPLSARLKISLPAFECLLIDTGRVDPLGPRQESAGREQQLPSINDELEALGVLVISSPPRGAAYPLTAAERTHVWARSLCSAGTERGLLESELASASRPPGSRHLLRYLPFPAACSRRLDVPVFKPPCRGSSRHAFHLQGGENVTAQAPAGS